MLDQRSVEINETLNRRARDAFGAQILKLLVMSQTPEQLEVALAALEVFKRNGPARLIDLNYKQTMTKLDRHKLSIKQWIVAPRGKSVDQLIKEIGL